LLKRGEGIVPELDRLVKGADAETADRIAKVRYNLAGYKDDIRRCILDIKSKRGLFDPIPGELNLPNELRYLIADHQPGSGDLLLAMAADEKGQFWYETRHLFVQAWDVMTADQLDRHIRQTVRLGTTHRPKFPAKVPAMISFEAGLRDAGTDWPNPVPKGFTFRARTTRYLDGKPYDKPYDRNDPVATVGLYRVGELSEGKHTIHAVMEYEFTQNGQKRKGEIRSKDSTFEVVSADTPDDLIAPKSDALTKAVHDALKFLNYEGEDNRPAFGGPFGGRLIDGANVPWNPQVSWQVDKDKKAGIYCPVCELRKSVPDDLCFDVEIRDVKTGKAYPADPIVLIGNPKTEAGAVDLLLTLGPIRGYVVPRNPRAFAEGRDGFVPVKVVFKPSRGLALSNPGVTRYFAEEIESGELKMRVIPRIEPPNMTRVK
jgi:hypothetical protein